MKDSHLDRILGRLDDLDSANLNALVHKLARERHLLETVFNTIQEGVLVTDKLGKIEYSNQAANRMIGIATQNIGKGTLLWKYVPDLSKSLFFEESDNNFSICSREVEITYPDRRLLRLYIVPLIKEKSEDFHNLFTIILSDVTEAKAKTEKMLEDEKLASIFKLAAGVAHEIGNPLNSIHIHLQLMQRHIRKFEPDNSIEKINNSLDICVSEVKRLEGIIDHFLKAVRPSKPSLTEIHLLEVLDEVLGIQAKEVENLGILVEIKLDKSLPIILGDRNQIKQVFFNVIKNAMEAMTNNGKLEISTYTDDQYAYIIFKDNGSGIKQENLAQIFEPYYSTKAKGSGLGMMIVQRIMHDHRGHIGIDSNETVGTKVTLQFPLKNKRFKMLE